MASTPAEYLASRGDHERKASGEVYTPGALAEFVLRRVGLPGRVGPILDPAAGCGAFLLAAQRLIVGRAMKDGLDASDAAERDALIATLSETLVGIDISSAACEVARALLRSDLADQLPGVPLQGYDPKITVGDFLDIVSGKAPRPAHWPAEGFATIVGNPPYVQLPRLDASRRADFYERFKTAEGRFDLYALFLEGAVSQLRVADAVVGFIIPNRVLTTVAANPLRRMLSSAVHVREIIDLHEARVFTGVDAYPLVVIADRESQSPDVEVLRFLRGRKDTLDTVASVLAAPGRKSEAIERFTISRASLGGGAWKLLPPTQRRVHGSILRTQLTASDFVARWGIGTATGRDAIYVVGEAEAKFLEPGLLKPTIRGRDLRPYRLRDPKKWLILPYSSDSKRPRKLVDLAGFPKIESYLDRSKSALMERSCVTRPLNKREWFEHHEIPDPALARTPKVLWPDVAAQNSFVFDEGKYHPLHSCYFAIPNCDAHFLVGVLNSLPLQYYLTTTLPRISGGHFRYQKRFVAAAPMPSCDPDTQAAIAHAARKGRSEDCDILVSGAFGLDDAEIESMRKTIR